MPTATNISFSWPIHVGHPAKNDRGQVVEDACVERNAEDSAGTVILSLVCMALSLRCEPFDPSFIGFSQRCRGERLAAKPLAPELAAIGVF